MLFKIQTETTEKVNVSELNSNINQQECLYFEGV